MKNLTVAILAVTLAVVGFSPTAFANDVDIYVDISNPSCPGSGTQSDPYCTIQDALDSVLAGGTIQVADGIYLEKLSFLVPSNIDFTLTSQNGPEVTIIDGSTALPLDAPVIEMWSTGQTIATKINGFTITGGSGVWGEYGGGMFMFEASATLSNNIITGNNAEIEGGGIWCQQNCTLVVEDTLITDNTAGNEAGALFLDGPGATISGCTISGNSAGFRADAILTIGGGSTFTLDSSIVYANGPTLDNNEIVIVSGDFYIDYSDIEGGESSIHQEASGYLFWGDDNLDVDPLFVGGGDYHLRSNSPLINWGDPDYVPTPGETDIDGEPRVQQGRIDMGADECIAVFGDYDGDGIVDLVDFANWPGCMTGPGLGPYPGGCHVFDSEPDNDVDLADFAVFQAAFTGP